MIKLSASDKPRTSVLKRGRKASFGKGTEWSSKQPSFRTRIYEEIRNEIMSGAVSPGRLLVERRLADRFNVSKTPVREALMDLCQDGLVEAIPRAGYSVTKIGLNEVSGIFRLRQALEVEAAATAAHLATPKDLDRLGEILGELTRLESESNSRVVRSNRRLEYCNRNRAFHLAIAEAAKIPMLTQFIDRLMIAMERLLTHDFFTATSLQELGTEHSALLKAIRRGDSESAKQLMREHISRTEQRLLRRLWTVR
jgi:DNA-binding GntR family transcriptional regulator